jgi:hypothetical protein
MKTDIPLLPHTRIEVIKNGWRPHAEGHRVCRDYLEKWLTFSLIEQHAKAGPPMRYTVGGHIRWAYRHGWLKIDGKTDAERRRYLALERAMQAALPDGSDKADVLHLIHQAAKFRETGLFR